MSSDARIQCKNSVTVYVDENSKITMHKKDKHTEETMRLIDTKSFSPYDWSFVVHQLFVSFLYVVNLLWTMLQHIHLNK